ncbi:MAG: glycosyltransferase family 9 protein [Ignavibacteriales bacterium]|nr:glycosyltransferase family 9 protein [Ignavibacteriales bacterium]
MMARVLLKSLEIAFRRLTMNVLRLFFRRRTRILPGGYDFSNAKFLFVRQDMIGDVLVSTPLFALTKERYPRSTVDVLLSSKNAFVLENDHHVRHRWVYDKRLRATVNLIRNIRREQYDFVIDLMDNPSATSTILCLLSRARWAVGIEKENAFAYDIRVPLRSRKEVHIVERIAEILKPFGITASPSKLAARYSCKPESRAMARQFLGKTVQPPKEIVGINISAGSARSDSETRFAEARRARREVRFWGVENFRAFIERTHLSHPQCVCVLLCRPDERTKAEAIAKGNTNAVVGPVTATFDEFAALVEQCMILVTPDTSAVHLASAFHIPAVVLYVQSNKDLRIWDPYGVDHESLVADVDDVKTIPVEDVVSAFARLYHRTHSS